MNYNQRSNNILTRKTKEMTKNLSGKKITNYFSMFMVIYMFMFQNMS